MHVFSKYSAALLAVFMSATAFAANNSFWTFGQSSPAVASASGSSSTYTFTPDETGIYLGALGGYGAEYNGGTNKSHDGGFAGGINGGYQFNSNLATEMGFTWLPNNTIANTPPTKIVADFYLFDIAIKPMITVDRFNIYTKFGLGIQDVSTTTTILGTSASEQDAYGAFYLGAGVGYSVTKQLQLVTDFGTTLGSTYNTMSIMAGLSYLFPTN